METVELFCENFGHKYNPPLIILHGFFASSRNWRQIAQKLSENYNVFVLDMRNHGSSPHHPLMDYPSMSADLLCFIDQHGLNKVNLIGHSMGGKVAMWFALNHSEYIDNLVMVDIAPVSYHHSFNEVVEALMALPLAQIHNRKQADEFLSASIPELSFRQFLLQNLSLQNGQYCWRIDLDIFYRMASNIVAFPDTGLLSPYPGKVLFIAGEKSNYVNADAIVELFPNAILEVVKGAGHWLHVEKPNEFINLLRSFLN